MQAVQGLDFRSRREFVFASARVCIRKLRWAPHTSNPIIGEVMNVVVQQQMVMFGVLGRHPHGFSSPGFPVVRLPHGIIVTNTMDVVAIGGVMQQLQNLLVTRRNYTATIMTKQLIFEEFLAGFNG